MQGTGSVVLVTGCSSGIGLAAVQELARTGCTVVATARRRSDIQSLEGERVDTLALDVTDADSVLGTVRTALERHGRIDAVVNNAGYGVLLPCEETPVEEMRRQYEVNLFGVARLTQAVLPAMHAQGSGRIVNVSSIAGHVSFPMMGTYAGSKHALRAWTEALHGELRPHGIHACLVEPGRIATRFSQRSRSERGRIVADPAHSPYAHLYQKWDRVGPGEARGAPPRRVARRILHACTAKRPRFRYLVGWDAHTMYPLRKLLPDAVVRGVTALYFGRGAR